MGTREIVVKDMVLEDSSAVPKKRVKIGENYESRDHGCGVQELLESNL